MTDSLDTANRVEGSKVNAVARVLDEIMPLAKPRRPRPRLFEVDTFLLDDGLEQTVETDGRERVEVTFGQDGEDSQTACMDRFQAIRFAEAILRCIDRGVTVSAPMPVVRARVELRHCLDEMDR